MIWVGLAHPVQAEIFWLVKFEVRGVLDKWVDFSSWSKDMVFKQILPPKLFGGTPFSLTFRFPVFQSPLSPWWIFLSGYPHASRPLGWYPENPIPPWIKGLDQRNLSTQNKVKAKLAQQKQLYEAVFSDWWMDVFFFGQAWRHDNRHFWRIFFC